MTIKQVSVFLENKPGQMLELCDVLAAKNINMRALSLADTSDFGIARIIVDNAEEAEAVLRAENYVVTITPVLLIEMPDVAGSLIKTLRLLADNDCSIEYMYAFTGKKTNSAYMIMRATNTKDAEKILASKNIHMTGHDELKNL